MTTEKLHYQRSANIALREVIGETFLIMLNAGESRMFALNDMGLWFWQNLESPQTAAQLVTAMLAEYEVTPEQAQAEVERFLAYLLDKDLIKLIDTRMEV